MPYIITTSLYPSHKASEVGEKYLEAMKKFPPDGNLGTQVVPAAIKATEQGIKVVGISEIKKGKFEESLTRAVNFMVIFRDIPGFEYTIDTYLTVTEALATLGMSMPE